MMKYAETEAFLVWTGGCERFISFKKHMTRFHFLLSFLVFKSFTFTFICTVCISYYQIHVSMQARIPAEAATTTPTCLPSPSYSTKLKDLENYPLTIVLNGGVTPLWETKSQVDGMMVSTIRWFDRWPLTRWRKAGYIIKIN